MRGGLASSRYTPHPHQLRHRPARRTADTRILLKVSQGEVELGWTAAAIAATVAGHPTTVARVRQT